jgi:uncharacterized protein (TIGR03437 family)
VTIAAGTTQASFTANASAVTADTHVQLTASYGGQSANTTVTLKAPAPAALSSLSCVSATVAPGAIVGCTVSLDKAAGANTAITISHNGQQALSAPSMAIVSAGASSVTFTVTAASGGSGAVTLTASYSGATRTFTLTIQTPTQLSVACNPDTLTPPASTQCTVTMTPAPSGATVVALSSGNTSRLPVPASVTIAGGATQASFTANAAAVTTTTPVQVTASYGGQSGNTTVTLYKTAVLSSLTCTSSTVTAGASVGCTVKLSKAPGTTASVAVSHNGPGLLTAPTSLLMFATATTASFVANTSASASGTVIMSASYGGVTKTFALTINSSQSSSDVIPTAVSCNPNPATIGAQLLCTVTFNKVTTAPIAIVLASSGSDIVLFSPPLTVPTGQSSLNFVALTRAGAAPQTARLTATIGTTSAFVDVVLIAGAQSGSVPGQPTAQLAGEPLEGRSGSSLAAEDDLPLIDRVVNEAGGGLQACSPGSMASVVGYGLTGASEETAQLRINGEEAVALVRSAGRITFLCPGGWPSPDLTVTVHTTRGASNSLRIPMRESTPGIFTVDDVLPGQGMIVVRDTNRIASLPSPAANSAPARPGDMISLFVTGLGATIAPAGVAMQDDPSLRSRIQLLVDGVPAEVTYAAALAGIPGIYQVDARIPLAAMPGQRVPVQMRVALTDGREAVSNQATLSVEDR